MSNLRLSITASVWAPLRGPLFRAFWISSVISSIGTWMHEVGAAWLMTTLTISPVMVALLHTAASLPMFLLALPSGAIADIWDRRKILLLTSGWMFASATTLCVIALLGVTTPWLLLILTFALGVGAAMNAPAWQSTTPTIVPRRDIPAAVALTGLGLNIARAVGPAFGGLIVKFVGVWAVFLLNAASFLGIWVVIFSWRGGSEQKSSSAMLTKRNIVDGLHFALREHALRAVLIRVSLLIPFASAPWVLLPLVARYDHGLSCWGYGVLFGCLGIGSVIGALLLSKLQCHLTLDTLVAIATILFAGATALLAEVRDFGLLCFVLSVGGVAWITLMFAFNVATQTAVPSWIMARGRALYLLSFHGSMAAGSLLWGALAQSMGVSVSLLVAAVGMFASVFAFKVCSLPGLGIISRTDHPAPTVKNIAPASIPIAADKLPSKWLQALYRQSSLRAERSNDKTHQ